MAEEMSDTVGEEKSNSKRTLRTCLIIGAGCAGILAIGICVSLAIGIPFVRGVMQDVGWTAGQDLIDVLSEDLQATLGADLGEEFDQEMLEQIESTLEAVVPEEMGESITEALPDVVFRGIQFSYPDGEDYGALPSVLPPEVEVEWFNLPERIVFDLTGYPLEDKFHEPQIIVMRTEDLLAVNSGVEAGLDELRQVLQTQPSNLERVPFVMPSFNAAQMITTQIAYIPFGSGQAVRFVTQYGQAAWPINNTDLFYAFQGLTDDGAYLITAVLPVTHPSLPMDGESLIGDDYEGFIATYDDYLAATKQSLNTQTPDSFTPGLQALDSMMSTFQVEVP
jgi:hypothetical protein